MPLISKQSKKILSFHSQSKKLGRKQNNLQKLMSNVSRFSHSFVVVITVTLVNLQTDSVTL